MVYLCKYCNSVLGQIDAHHAMVEQLGFSILTDDEKADMMTVDEALQTTYVKTVCEHCEAALRYNPELILSHTPLQ